MLCEQLEHAVFLESGTNDNNSNFDILSAAPRRTLEIKSLFDSKKLLNKIKAFENTCLIKPKKHDQKDLINSNIPFTNGLIGFFSYETGKLTQLKSLQTNSKHHEPDHQTILPQAFIGHFTWSYVYDHKKKQGFISFSPQCPSMLREKILNLITMSEHQTHSASKLNELEALQWKKSQTFDEYTTQFLQIQNYIREGDCYQVNLTQRFEANSSKKASELYFATQEKIQTPYSCYMAFSDTQHLLCFSPEQFISISNKVITTKPIKGTIANNGTKLNINTLQNSKKNQAENIMIVDLLRNDFGKVCKPHSVNVPELFKIETFQNVHHLVSQIKGKLKDDINELEAFISCFPGGSITGAPKIRAMEIINELEKYSRDAYCGSVFYLDQSGNFDSNILIRSVIKNGNQLYCWAGGGIVADSELMDEYQESLTKVSNITGLTE